MRRLHEESIRRISPRWYPGGELEGVSVRFRDSSIWLALVQSHLLNPSAGFGYSIVVYPSPNYSMNFVTSADSSPESISGGPGFGWWARQTACRSTRPSRTYGRRSIVRIS